MQTSSHSLPGKVIRWIILGMMCLSLGLQWAVIQGIAWTSMLVSYSQSDGFFQAVSKTFDGQHPCPLCEAVEEGGRKTSGKDAEGAKPSLKKFEAVVADTLRIVPPAAGRLTYPNLIQKAEAGNHPPPEGPPRGRA
jgi:hypothetical protein